MILGAILAGGRARRFGADKASAEVGGVALLDRVAAALRPECDALVVVGRDWPGLARVEDRPGPGLGPLGGLAGALYYAQINGFAEVLASGCDLPELPHGLAGLLRPAPAVVAGQPLLGLWPVTLAGQLTDYLDGGGRAVRGWADVAGARAVATGPLANINTPDDLAAFREMVRRRGGGPPAA